MNNIYPWQNVQWKYIQARINDNSLPHALLLSGQAGMGKQQFALCLANAVLCSQRNLQGEACHQCKACLLFAAHNHPDFSFIEPEGKDKPIKIDKIRQLTQALLTTTHIGNYKAAIIHRAETMNTAAANALLKTLEEPEGQTLLILTTHLPSLLPATIRSRCQLVNFPPVLDDKAKQWLAKQLSSEMAEEYLQLSEGAPLEALALQEDIAKREDVLASLLKIAGKKASFIAVAANYQKVELMECINLIINVVSDIIKLSLASGDRYIYNKGYLAELQKLAKCATLTKLYNYLDMLINVRQQWLNNINFNQQLLIEKILHEWQQCFN